MNARIYRMLVTGSPETTEAQERFVWRSLSAHTWHLMYTGTTVIIVQGECPTGVDRTAKKWATEHRADFVRYEGFEADRARLHEAAECVRNRQMVAAGADICIGFPRPGSTDTWDCLRQAADAGIHCRVYPLPDA
jgi:hypothetical protein